MVVAGFLVCSFGLQKGLERDQRSVMMLCLLVLIRRAGRSQPDALDGAAEGMKFYLVPSTWMPSAKTASAASSSPTR